MTAGPIVMPLTVTCGRGFAWYSSRLTDAGFADSTNPNVRTDTADPASTPRSVSSPVRWFGHSNCPPVGGITATAERPKHRISTAAAPYHWRRRASGSGTGDGVPPLVATNHHVGWGSLSPQGWEA